MASCTRIKSELSTFPTTQTMKIGPYVSSCRHLNECFYVKSHKSSKSPGRGLKCILKERRFTSLKLRMGCTPDSGWLTPAAERQSCGVRHVIFSS
jgi:hypothetical protein